MQNQEPLAVEGSSASAAYRKEYVLEALRETSSLIDACGDILTPTSRQEAHRLTPPTKAASGPKAQLPMGAPTLSALFSTHLKARSLQLARVCVQHWGHV